MKSSATIASRLAISCLAAAAAHRFSLSLRVASTPIFFPIAGVGAGEAVFVAGEGAGAFAAGVSALVAGDIVAGGDMISSDLGLFSSAGTVAGVSSTAGAGAGGS